MAMRFTPVGLQSLGNGTIDFDTDTINAGLLVLDGSLTVTAVKAVTGATNANPVVYAVDSTTGWTTGDLLVVRGIGGNTSANQTGLCQIVDGTHFSLKTLDGSRDVAGNGAYTSGGCVVNLTLGDDWADVDGAVLGTPVALASKTVAAGGIIDATDADFAAFTGTAHAWMVYESGGKNLLFNDGKSAVTVAADAASSATTLWVQRLEVPIASGTAMVFSNGVTATTSSDAAVDARSIAVSALSGGIAAGHQADVAGTNSGLPYTAAGTGVALQFAATGIGQY